MGTTVQRSFAGGEIAPALYGRADQTKYATGLRTCENWLVMRYGGIENRPGTEFVCEVKDSTKAPAFIKFEFNDDQTYVIEFGEYYMRVIRKGGLLVVSGLDAWTTATAYGTSDLVAVAGVNYYCTADHTSGTFATDLANDLWYALTGDIYEIPTPYAEADLIELRFVQSGDVVTIAHGSYPTRELRRTGHTAWILANLIVAPGIDRPRATSVTGSAGSVRLQYRVTAVNKEDFEEGLPGYGAAVAISSVARAVAGGLITVTTSAAHNLQTGDEVGLEGTGVEADGNWSITVTAATTFTLNDSEDSDTFTSSTGDVLPIFGQGLNLAEPTTANPVTVSWNAVPGSGEYNIYRSLNGVYGWVGVSGGASYVDDGGIPDTTDTPPIYRDPFAGAGNYPSTVSYSQQRLLLASTDNEPEKIWGSRTGNFKNFTVRSPLQDDDSLTWQIASRKVNRVRSMIDIGRLVILTSAGEWTAKGNGSGTLTPTSPNLVPESHHGANSRPPIIIGNSALYIQSRGNIVRDLRYQLESDGYSGRDLTVYAPHMFSTYPIVDWDYAQAPHSILWAARSDGTLLGLTYVREHEVWGWHRHTTKGGFIERVVSVAEGDEDVVYLAVRRKINGVVKRYIERMHTRKVTNPDDAFFVDCGLTYDGANPDPAHTMRLSDIGEGWSAGSSLNLNSTEAHFTADDVGSRIRLDAVDPFTGETVSVVVTIYYFWMSTIVLVTADVDIPEVLQAATSDWHTPASTISGLDHLEGEILSIAGDGTVVFNGDPDDDIAADFTVTGGSVTLPRAYFTIHAGLPITATAETLDLETLESETLIGKKKRVNQVSLLVEGTSGLWAGPDADHLNEAKLRQDENMGDPVALRTGLINIILDGTWNSHGRVMIRQTDPLPATILSIAPSGIVGS